MARRDKSKLIAKKDRRARHIADSDVARGARAGSDVEPVVREDEAIRRVRAVKRPAAKKTVKAASRARRPAAKKAARPARRRAAGR
jgi:hypothetical protein